MRPSAERIQEEKKAKCDSNDYEGYAEPPIGVSLHQWESPGAGKRGISTFIKEKW
jgi:hypothetical protein